MKQILKTLFRHKSYTILNLIGLSTAFAAFVIISMQIRYDITYNTHVENTESVYMLNLKMEDKSFMHWFNRQIPIAIKNVAPEIEYMSVSNSFSLNQIGVKVSESDEPLIVSDVIHKVEPDFLHIHNFEFVEGDHSSIDDYGDIIISDKFAKKYFGSQSPIGKSIFLNSTETIISGVFVSFSDNTSISGDLFVNIGNENIDNRSNYNYTVWMKSFDSIDKELFAQKLLAASSNQTLLDIYGGGGEEGAYIPVIGGTPLKDVRHVIYGYDLSMLYVMIALAISIILLASINFVNFASSMAPLKIKGINLRKVVGATKTELRIGMIGESLTLVVIALIMGLAFVQLFLDSSYSSILDDYSFDSNVSVYIITIALSVIVGVVSGLYPAFYTTSFKPALVLNGSYAMSASGRKFRSALICFQFFVTISFIVCAMFIQLQHDYMMNRDGGYDKENIIHVKHGWTFDKHDILEEELSSNSNFNDITFSNMAFGTSESIMSWGRGYSGGQCNIFSMPVSDNFLDFFGIEILSGRDFMQTDNLCENGYFIMSKMAMDKYEFIDGEKISGHRDEPTDIIGVCENVNIVNMTKDEYPFAFYIYGKHPWNNLPDAYIKFAGDREQAIAFVRDTYKKIDPNVLPVISYMTDDFEVAYKDENTFKQIMVGFSIISIIIALVGVFGLVSFDTRYRRKEIGIRKVNGASINEILALFSFAYVKFILIGFVVSVPIVYVGISNWLEQFPYKIEIYWWVFAIALAIVFILTLMISIMQSWSAARENPMNVIK